MELLRQDVKTQKVALITEAMNFTDAEGEAFWPIYDEYWAEMSKLGDREVALISNFAKNYVYESLTNQKAKEMHQEWISIKKQVIKLQQKYAKKFRKVLPEKKVLRYFQIENKLDLIIDSELAAEIPLAR